MNWHEEELKKRLRRLKETESSPRPEYVRETERRLQLQTNQLKRRLHFQRVANRVAGVAAIVLLGGWVSTDSGQKSLQTLWSYTIKHEQPSATIVPAPTPESAQPPPFIPLPANMTKENKVEKRPAETNHSETTTVGTEQKQQPEKALPPVATSPIKQTVTVTDATPMPPSVKKAETYVQEMLGEQGKHYRYNPSQSDLKRGTIGFSRVVHGIPVYEASYTVEMNGDQVLNFQISQQSDLIGSLAQIPKPTDVLSKEEAEEAIASTLRLVYREKGGAIASLYFESDFSGFIDAKTGALVSGKGAPIQRDEGKRIIPVAAEGRQLVANTWEETLSLLIQEFGMPFRTDNRQGTTAAGSDGTREYHWVEKDSELSARTNQNGQLLSYRVNKSEDSTTSSTKNQAASSEVFLQPAIEHLQRYLDKTIKELELTGIEREASEIRFLFTKLYQGIPVIDHSYEVIVDTATGEVVGMSGPFGQGTASFPDPTKAISKEAAVATLRKNQSLELTYIWTDKNGTSNKQALLVYQVNKEKGMETSIDAITGTMVEPVQESP
ncbi:YcdB/YcdC domain-containing protein [Brevibacillus brevis]|uniref:YcdB/YcdC domain-containing protein n=1 Tax=Brevibacillus brevis TaxID=1393 RepID=UPI000D10AA76|nr:YcdB/YcdC domain-containing protein [Brevibacillus brevis]PSJ63515.1 hypothetical protein C7J99_31460 [Brevibacillus brevis]RED20983.1 hypothetical protein DES34_12522 [Brevibacillus brevis]GEC93472.1 hypothetical protein BBR01nite_58030 [Brevibacillus brevis]VEF86341.1 Uncharacterised protein [Brevibacillus brevis]